MKTHTHDHTCTHCGCNDPFGKSLLNAIIVAANINTEVSLPTPPLPKPDQQNNCKPLIISGGTIRPVTQGNADITVDAIGVLGGNIIAVGTLQHVKKAVELAVEQKQQQIGEDLSQQVRQEKINELTITHQKLTPGQTLLPGLIDPHVHICGDALISNFISFSGVDKQMMRHDYDLDYITTTLNIGISGEANKDTETSKNSLQSKNIVPTPITADSWIMGKDIDPSFMPFDGDLLTTLDLATLDGLNGATKEDEKYPLAILSASAHTLYINTKASEATWKFWDEYDDSNYSPLAKIDSLKAWLEKTRYTTYQSFASNTDAPNKLTKNDFVKKYNGQLQEMEQILWALCAVPYEQLARYINPQAVKRSLQALLSEALGKGMTFLYDAAFSTQQQTWLRKEQDKNADLPPVRIGGALEYADLNGIKQADDCPRTSQYQYAFTGNIKLVSDGSNQGLTGYQYQSYYCYPPLPKDVYEEKSKGIFNFNMEPKTTQNEMHNNLSFPAMVNTAINEKGWPLMIHANGDSAIDNTIEVYKAAYTNAIDIGYTPLDWADMRHRIEHCSLLDADRITSMKEFALSPSFLIGHVGYWGYAFEQIIFKEQAKKCLDLCQSSIAAGAKITLHSDFPVSPIGTLRLMEQSMTRVTEASPAIKDYTKVFRQNNNIRAISSQVSDENTLNIAERLTGSQALAAATYNAAWQCHADAWLGSLEIGKFADFVILKIDPVTMKDPFLKMRDTDNVLETWVAGEKVFSHESIKVKDDAKSDVGRNVEIDVEIDVEVDVAIKSPECAD
ncbi:amidohydrolase family protein [Shewanella sp. KX20019]|uniref:amidohydrolase family protein n=1 Tax=Shewanella sp. KX20019 TaxID=2803864 RepID=UPI001927B0BE|nr:amidohydrolase family protein [Shewanella sp. KX20019]QQX79644.1 amidohydrolase family protein [Shewanella sp. KX20019]